VEGSPAEDSEAEGGTVPASSRVLPLRSNAAGKKA